MVSMSDMKHNAIVGSGTPILKRYDTSIPYWTPLSRLILKTKALSIIFPQELCADVISVYEAIIR